MKLRTLFAAAAFAVAALPALAAPTVIGFESLAHADEAIADAGQVYTEAGYTFANAGDFPFATIGSQAFDFLGSTALINDNNAGLTTLTRSDGGLFALLAIDLAELFAGSGEEVSVLFSGLRADGSSVSQRFTLDDVFGTETFSFAADFSNLVSVSWTNDAAYHQFDNVTVAAVPEPGSAALAGLALVSLGATLRRRRRG
ncbi:PEP-CTERM sorting domain-containing protein [Rubrivivax gelatinosus]|nr:PEP-CTERM sorting domain-containing protein [Rubrivivax gelatinosus]